MSVPFKGDYAPDLFNEAKRYYLFQAQEHANLTDAELRDMHQISNTLFRRFVNAEMGDGAIDNGFKIAQHPTDASNNFLITGGDGTLDNPGVFYAKGYYHFLKSDIGYKDQNSTGDMSRDGYTKSVIPALTTPQGSTQNLNATSQAGGIFWAAGYSSEHTTDCGRSWTVDNAFANVANDMVMIDTLNGYAVTDGGFVLTTINGATTWTSSYVGTGNLRGLSFINYSNGWAVGTTAKIYQMKAGAWIGANPTDTVLDLNSVWAYDTTKAWAVGVNGIIEFTGNGGTNWSQQGSPTSVNLNKVLGRSATVLYAFGDGGTIIKTANGGSTWSSLTTGTTQNLYGAWFANDSTGWAVGANGSVTKTTNAGSSWTTQSITSTTLKAVVFSDDRTGFAVGSLGLIYRTLDGNTWEKYRTDNVYIDTYLAEASADSTGGSEYLDPELEDVVIGLPSANRLRVVSDVLVSEGWAMPASFVDASGRQHYTSPLAKLNRSAGVSNITNFEDTRNVVLTLSEITDKIVNGGIDASSIADGSITPAKLDPSATYNFGAVQVAGDTTISGNLRVDGAVHVSDYTTNLTINNLTVHGSSILGTTTPSDDTVSIHGRIIQDHSASAPAYDLVSAAGTLTAPVFNILSQGQGTVFYVNKTSDSTNPIISITSAGKGYEFVTTRSSTLGGFLSLSDDASGNSFYISKMGGNNSGSVFYMATNKTSPTIYINNLSPTPSVSFKIDQTAGTIAQFNALGNANGLALTSTGNGTDISIKHASTSGKAADITGSVYLVNNSGMAMNVVQNDNYTLLNLVKDATGDGRVIEISNYGHGTALQVNTDGTGISQHISHVGDSSNPALHIYVAGNETGPAIYVDKANDNSGGIFWIRNGGTNSTFYSLQDNTDSSASMFTLDNRGTGLDFSSAGWKINGSTLYMGDITSTRWKIDASGNLMIKSIQVDYASFDSSNPGIAGKFYRDSSNFIKVSSGI